jgi:arylamine N-acetyltransferase
MITQELYERVLSKLGFNKSPATDLQGLGQIYSAWCATVPFDNSLKMIHVTAQDPGPLPGETPADFLESWLVHGAGGTCWSGNGALHALLERSGFSVSRGVATMMASPNIPPNHGTVVVDLDGENYLVDASILHREPMRLTEANDGLPFGIQIRMEDGRWHVRWKPLHRAELDCRIEYWPTTQEDFRERYEMSRGWSPFNYTLTARVTRSDCSVGVAGSEWVQVNNDGTEERRVVDDEERAKLLVDVIGFREELVRRIPKDQPTPPRPVAAATHGVALHSEG